MEFRESQLGKGMGNCGGDCANPDLPPAKGHIEAEQTGPYLPGNEAASTGPTADVFSPSAGTRWKLEMQALRCCSNCGDGEQHRDVFIRASLDSPKPYPPPPPLPAPTSPSAPPPLALWFCERGTGFPQY